MPLSKSKLAWFPLESILILNWLELVILKNSWTVVLSAKTTLLKAEGVNLIPIVKSDDKEICPVVCRLFVSVGTKVKTPAE